MVVDSGEGPKSNPKEENGSNAHQTWVLLGVLRFDLVQFVIPIPKYSSGGGRRIVGLLGLDAGLNRRILGGRSAWSDRRDHV